MFLAWLVLFCRTVGWPTDGAAGVVGCAVDVDGFVGMVGWAVERAGSDDSFSFEFLLGCPLLQLLVRLLLFMVFCLFNRFASVSFMVSVWAMMVGLSTKFIV